MSARAGAIARGPGPPPRATPEIRHLYVHAPFCARRCRYCDFAVTVDRRPQGGRWLHAIEAELAILARGGEVRLADRIETLYLGGGTPSLLNTGAVAGLGAVVGAQRMAEDGFEWTAEANPESFGDETARAWVRAGVNRISFGVQSFDPGALRWMGRLHSAADAARAIALARAAGIGNLSLDLIFGLPGTVARDWRRDLERALSLNAPHISLYGLTIEEGTPLARLLHEGRIRPVGEERYSDEYLLAAELLAAAGYDHYELSNFARPGFASRHNLACWRGAPYLGLGNGAHSFHGGRRTWNERDWARYATRIEAGGLARSGSERPNSGQRRLEELWLALRTTRGVDPTTLSPAALPRLQSWCARGLATDRDDRIRLTPRGWLLLDSLAVELDAACAHSPSSASPLPLPFAPSGHREIAGVAPDRGRSRARDSAKPLPLAPSGIMIHSTKSCEPVGEGCE